MKKMKKIRCDWVKGDFIRIADTSSLGIILHTSQNGKWTRIRIGADKIRKLRKQLKRALIEIEGEKDDLS